MEIYKQHGHLTRTYPNQFFNVIVINYDYDIKNLIIMLKIAPRNVGVKSTKSKHADRVIVIHFRSPRNPRVVVSNRWFMILCVFELS